TELNSVAHGLAYLAEHRPVVCRVHIRARRAPVRADLHHSVTLFHGLGRATGHLTRVRLRGASDTRIHAHAIPPAAAEQVRKTLARDLAENIPERDVNPCN